MDKEKDAVNTTDPAADQTVVVDDNEAKIAALEAEKAKITEEAANWKIAALKAKSKSKEEVPDLDEDERIELSVKKAIADSRMAEILREQQDIITKTLKENKELKLARLNTKEPPVAAGTHSESISVRDTVVTPEQMTAFKARGWDDKKIERYKKNLQRYAGR